jgi:type 2 lantibiotic biosynthesis protein LanM
VGGGLARSAIVSIQPAPDAAVGQPSWWARGLSLAERLPAVGEPDPARVESARRRFERWSAAHDLAASGQFARRLADSGLDEDALLTLLTEAPAPLAARTEYPRWARFVQRALAGEPVKVNGGGPASWQEQFAVSLGRLTAAAVDEVSRRVEPLAVPGRLDTEELTRAFAGWLGLRLARLAARTLVLELNVARVRGTLTRETAGERFAEFAESLSTEEGLAALFDEYPVLARLLGQACEMFVDAFAELLERFAADRDAIVEALLDDTDPGPLQRIELGHGDSHQGGRMVAILRFAEAAVVYKPRGQSMQRRFGGLIRWFNRRLPGLGLRAPVAMLREGYGWVEHIAHRPCSEVSEVDRFYRRQGALLALLYALDGTDIHCENLIAAGDQPVLVDVETLFHPTIVPVNAAGEDPAARALSESVCRTALLPLLLVGEHGALDISGLGGDRGAVFPFAVIGWDDTGTDGMRVVRAPAEFLGHDNQPRLGDSPVDPADYRAALLTGFHDGYDAILANRDELARLVEAVADEQIRVVIRPTSLYATLLDESTHPDVLRDGLDRDPVLDMLWADAAGDPLKEHLTRHELADLWAGDVPIFFGRAGERDVWTSTGERLTGVLPASGLESVLGKLARLDEVDRHDQDWLITATFATRTGPIRHHSGLAPPRPVATAVPGNRQLLTAACSVADELVARAVHGRDGVERANWLGLELVDDQHWGVLPLGAGLANGYTGVALFLAQLGGLTGTARYLDLAARALRPIPRLLSTLEQNPDLARSVGPGGFLGTGGICYGLGRISVLLEDSEVHDWFVRSVNLVPHSDDGTAGFAAGRAGGVAALLAAHAETGLAAAADAATILADRLVRDTGPDENGAFPATGFAGGQEGIVHALRRCAGTRFTSTAAEVLDRATPLSDRVDDADHSWCCGLAGALVVRTSELDLDRAIAVLRRRNPVRDLSLCHGELGVLEALTVLAERGLAEANAALAPAVARLLGALDQWGPRCGTPDGVPTPGLLTGLAGIGYGLLRLGFTERVPSVLMLEPGGPM